MDIRDAFVKLISLNLSIETHHIAFNLIEALITFTSAHGIGCHHDGILESQMCKDQVPTEEMALLQLYW